MGPAAGSGSAARTTASARLGGGARGVLADASAFPTLEARGSGAGAGKDMRAVALMHAASKRRGAPVLPKRSEASLDAIVAAATGGRAGGPPPAAAPAGEGDADSFGAPPAIPAYHLSMHRGVSAASVDTAGSGGVGADAAKVSRLDDDLAALMAGTKVSGGGGGKGKSRAR